MSEPTESPAVETTGAAEAPSAAEPSLPSIEDAMAAMFAETPTEAPATEAPPAPAPVAEAQPPAPPPPPPPAPVEQDDKRFERYAAKERELAQVRQEIEARHQEIVERENKLARLEKFEQELQEGDPLVAFEQLGYKFEDLARAAAAGRGVRPNKKLEEGIQSVQAELARLKQEQAAAQQRQLEQAARAEVSREMGARSPLLTQFGDTAVELVISHARRHASDGRPVLYEAVVADAEKEILSFVEKALSVESVRNRFLPSQQPATQVAQPQQAGSRTLTNSQATSVSKRVDQPNLDELPDDVAIDQLFANPSAFFE